MRIIHSFIVIVSVSIVIVVSIAAATDATAINAPPVQAESTTVGHQVSAKKMRRHAEVPGPLPVAVVIIYRTLGQLLPENYDVDRRSLRYCLPLGMLSLVFV